MNPLYCIVGPSGTGKSTLEKNIQNELPFLQSVKSYTTRPRRNHNDRGHIFTSPEHFSTLELLTYTKYDNFEYGVDKTALDNADIFVVDPIGVKKLRKNYSRPLVVIGLDASESTRCKRMLARGDSEEQANQRLDYDRQAFNDYDKLCDIMLDANASEDEVLSQFIDEVIAQDFAELKDEYFDYSRREGSYEPL